MWTFSNSTWKGQLKNVQDEISRPLGSRKIQKTKVETVLRDTLYKHQCLNKIKQAWAELGQAHAYIMLEIKIASTAKKKS